jgi:D-alanyl-lipoteichoic acid acyltransferase DltB (MBOAT superfamily)
MKLVALVFAWDLVLSSYSYCVEMARTTEPPSRRDCLFFLFVNPALVYSQRGHRIGPATFDRVGLRRILLGTLIFLSTWLVLMPVFRLLNQRSASNGLSGLAYADLILCGLVAFAIQYAQASALASLQIGLLRQTGHQIPERYDWPIRAKTLPEFWRRWNTYVSQWALHYVFLPFSLRLGRRFRNRRSRTLITILALIGAFLVMGILHDAYTSLVPLVAKYHLTVMFLVNGVLVVLWLGLERIGQRAEDDGRLPKWVVPLASAVSRLCLWSFVAVCALWRISI